MKNDIITNKLNKLRFFLKEYFIKNTYPPTIREICNYMGFKSTSSAHKYLRLLRDLGEISIDSNISRGIKLEKNIFELPGINLVPLLSSIVSGQQLFAEESYTKHIPLPQSFFGYNDNLLLIKVSGSSMIDVGINDGDYIVIHKQPFASSGDIIAALIDNEYITVKRYYIDHNNVVRLHPENKNMSDVYPENIQVLGIVKGLIRTEVK
ncbi:MAG TPA: transcriptional repressor LexA [Clostridia bacterium]|jgi:repressor LexA|nr:transcriptional repressor LexA [Clostridia bacterium]